MSEIKGFLMTAEIAEKFFLRCQEEHANTLEERLAVMNQMIHEENIKILNEKRLKETVQGKKILVVDPKRDKNVRD